MATLQELRSDLNFAEFELTKARENLAQAEADLANSRANPNLQDLIVSQSNNLERARGRLEQAENRVNALNTEIRSVQAQGPGTTSAGQTVAQAQRANDDRADTISPGADTGTTAQAPGPTNAERFEPPPAEETDPALRTVEQTQSLPQAVAEPGAARGNITPPNSPNQNVPPSDDAVPTTESGASATKDDSAGNNNPTRAALNRLFANKIIPQSNVLDQYASYTYSISIYLMSPSDYQTLINDPNALPKGAQLILQTGGAPVAGGSLPTIDVQEAQQAADGNGAPLVIPELGRNPNFPLDYYLDDVRLQSVINGKGVGMAHNVFKLQFKVIEPNGITFLDNLYRATDQYVKLSGTPQINYAAQNYLMVVRFYGYDENGNLVQAQKLTGDFIDINSRKTQNADVSVEKFIPFQFTSIKFRVANKMVEYDCEAVGVNMAVAIGPARGVIPYNVELASQSLKDLLQGQQAFAQTGASAGAAGDAVRQGPDQSQAETARLQRQNAQAARSGVTQSNVSTATFAQRQATASERVRAARREQLGLSPTGAAASPAPVTAGTGSTQNSAPPKASAANSKTLVTGLVDALNSAQDEWQKKGAIKYPDRYFIELDPLLAEAKVVPPGSTNLRAVPMGANENPRDRYLEKTQAVDANAKKFSILAGTSIVQFLDQVVRNSTYIYDQQIKFYNPKTNKLENQGTPANVTGWYKISMQAVPQGADKYDTKRNDYAYDITYRVDVYGINDAKSDFFPSAQYRGTHKVYDYWFTGINTQILDFQQDFNYLYYIVQNANAPDRTRTTTNWREVPRYVAQPRSDQSDQMNPGSVSEPSAQLADYLYSPGDTARVKLRILGDPAWIQQGDVRGGLMRGAQVYDEFLPDGTINYNGQEILFEILWNKPVDYDLSIGLMDPGVNNYNANRKAGVPGQAVQTNVYKAVTCTSIFNRGRFEQELEGVQVYYSLEQAKQEQEQKREREAQAQSTDFRNPSINIPSASPGLQALEFGQTGEVNFKPTSLATVLDQQTKTKSIFTPQTPRGSLPPTAATSFSQTVGPATSPTAAKIAASSSPQALPAPTEPQTIAREP